MAAALTFRSLAQVVHEATRALALAEKAPDAPLTWEKAPDWQREATVDEVLTALAEPDDEQRWKDWRRTRQLAGWRYGPEFSGTQHTDPRMTETWANVPASAKRRLALVSAIVAAGESWL